MRTVNPTRMAQVRDFLSSIGNKVQNFDEAYSNKIADMYDRMPEDGNFGAVKGIGQLFGGGTPSFRGPLEDTSATSTMGSRFMAGAIPALNTIPKYAAPVAGLTLAGQGLAGLTNQIMESTGGPADGQEPGQLPFDQSLATGITVGALAGGAWEGIHHSMPADYGNVPKVHRII